MWEMGDGRWEKAWEVGGWKMENGKWKMEYERLEDGRLDNVKMGGWEM